MTKLSIQQAMHKAKNLAKIGQLDEAKSIYQAILNVQENNKKAKKAFLQIVEKQKFIEINLHPKDSDLQKLYFLIEQSYFDEAITLAKRLLVKFEKSSLLWCALGEASRSLGHLDDSEGALRKALELNPHDPNTLNNLAVTLKALSKYDQALQAYEDALRSDKDFYQIHFNKGNTLAELGRHKEAVKAYNLALSIHSNFPEALLNKGNACIALNEPLDAIEAFNDAIKVKPNYIEAYNNLASVYKDNGKPKEAKKALEKALEINPKFVEAHNNLGNFHKKNGDLKLALSFYKNAAKLQPDNPTAYNNIGACLKELEQLDLAKTFFQKSLELEPGHVDALFNLALIAESNGQLDTAIQLYQETIQLDHKFARAEAKLFHVKKQVCDFKVTGEIERRGHHLGTPSHPIPPFSSISWKDNPELQLRRAKVWAARNFERTLKRKFIKPSSRPPRLKIAYFSSDFFEHATMFLMSGIFENHNRKKFEIFVFDYNRKKTDKWQKKITANVDHFFQVASFSDMEILDLATSQNLDIAIDLKGYTEGSRIGIFQNRIAPIQISYLGYPNTTGADFIDYLIADPVVVPKQYRNCYSENIIYLPNSYQPNDNKRKIAQLDLTRSQWGLPVNGIVFSCFNSSFKISSHEFHIWMRILHEVEDSVLWLLSSNRWVEQNLANEAKRLGIEPERLIFSDAINHSEHLARFQLADLFLDTFNVNAHTTASDALWAGVPVLTMIGKQFAARVASSLLTAIGLPELITDSESQYERLAIQLAQSPQLLAEIKKKLNNNRHNKPLFNTKLYTRDFEKGLELAYRNYADGAHAHDIWV